MSIQPPYRYAGHRSLRSLSGNNTLQTLKSQMHRGPIHKNLRGGGRLGLGALAVGLDLDTIYNSNKKTEVPTWDKIKSYFAGSRTPPKKEAAADARPYRERVEAFAVDDDGRVYGGRYNKDRTFGTFGGGVDPGETPIDAAVREFLEESGRELLDAEPSGIEPVTMDWKAPYVSKKQEERAKKFRGSKTHFVLGRLGPETNKDRGEDQESNLFGVKSYSPTYARRLILKYLRGSENPTLEGRAKVLKKIIDRQKTAACYFHLTRR